MEKQWCRFCNVEHMPFNGHCCRTEDLKQHVVLLANRAATAEAGVDYLRVLLAEARPVNCDGLHHARKDRHHSSEPCPIIARIDAAKFPLHISDELDREHDYECGRANAESEALT
jgi:hypothetical protein